MDSLELIIKRIWSDAVWSKVISAGVLTAAAWIFGLWKRLWRLVRPKAILLESAVPNQGAARSSSAITSGNESPVQTINAAGSATVNQTIHYGSTPTQPPINASALIRGTVTEIYQVTFSEFTATLMVYVSIVNDSADVSPTIKHFICQITLDEVADDVLASKASNFHPITGLVRSSEKETVFDRGPFPNLCHWNSSPLVKHNHREGWLKFEIGGYDSSLTSTLSIILVDGADNEHLIGKCSQPWPHQEGVHFLKYSPGPLSKDRR